MGILEWLTESDEEAKKRRERERQEAESRRVSSGDHISGMEPSNSDSYSVHSPSINNR